MGEMPAEMRARMLAQWARLGPVKNVCQVCGMAGLDPHWERLVQARVVAQRAYDVYEEAREVWMAAVAAAGVLQHDHDGTTRAHMLSAHPEVCVPGFGGVR